MKIKEITNYLENIAPLNYQESYDNCGLICGSYNEEIDRILITLDSIESVIDEAINKKCDLIITHHPIVFKGLKQFNGKNYIERSIIKAIKENMAIYAIHTNLDNIYNGVNSKICERLGLDNKQILRYKEGSLRKFTTFVPHTHKEKVLNALSNVGAGEIGNYNHCSFQSEGIGTFQPNEEAKPHIGVTNCIEKVNEVRIEVILPAYLSEKVIAAVKAVHPYEEVAYYLYPLENKQQELGSGMIALLPKAMEAQSFLNYLKDRMKLSYIRHTALVNKKIKKIAVCGGAGSFLLKDAIEKKADIFITADLKYHEFFDAENQIIIADIGHYESEVFTKELLFDLLEKRFKTIDLIISQVNTNPIQYFI